MSEKALTLPYNANRRLFIALGTALSASGMLYWFNDYILSLPKLIVRDEYSYLIATSIVLSYLLFMDRKRIVTENYAWSIPIGFLSVLLSLYVYLSTSMTEYALQFGMLSIILWIWGTALLLLGITGVNSIKKILLLTLFLIPIPRELIDSLALKLGYTSAKISSFFTGAEIRETTTGLLLTLTNTAGDPIHFLVTMGCSGIISVTGILATIPLILYYTSNNKSPSKTIIAILGLSLFSAGIMYLGNIMRIILVLEASKYFGLETGMKIFHSTPSIITAIITAVIIVFIMKKYGIITIKEKRFVTTGENNYITEKSSIIGLLLITLMVIGGIAYFIYQDISPLEEVTEQKVYSINELLGEKSIILSTSPSSFNIMKTVERKDWETSLGIPKVYTMYLNYYDSYLELYLEISGQQNLFHGWPVCLTYQGYDILRSWVEPYNITEDYSIEIRYLSLKKDNLYYFMGYTVTMIPADYGGVMAPLYLKVTLLSSPFVDEETSFEKGYKTIKTVLGTYMENLVYNYGYYQSINEEEKMFSPQNIIGFLTGIVLAMNIIFVGGLFIKKRIK